MATGAFLFFKFGGSAAPLNTNDGALKTNNSAMSIGSPKAPVKIIEYGDFVCPYCSKFAHDIMPSIQNDYIKSGKVQVEFRPVAVIAADSQRAAEGSYCAAEQKKFWNYYDGAYVKTWDDYYSHGLKPEDVPIFKGNAIRSIAESSGLNVSDFTFCVDSGKYTQTVQNATKDFTNMSSGGTPTFLINRVQYQGYAPYSVIKPIIDSYLK